MPDEQDSYQYKRLNFSGVVPGTMLQAIVINIVCPYMAYSILTNHLPPLEAILLVTLFPIVGIGNGLIRQRLLDPLAIAALIIIGCIIITSYIITNPLISHILHYALPIGSLGLVMLITQLLPYPTFLLIDRYYHTHSEPETATQYKNYWYEHQSYRHMINVLNASWGGVQLITALLIAVSSMIISSIFYLQLIPFIACIPYIILLIWSVQYEDNILEKLTPEQQETDLIETRR
ncbi:MAG TPA: hypothetical protein VL461_00340 [Dictyobacter sp.]|jgi:hypothetical protein|nr:hypothetical protein [Dictyobacter sp.]